MVIINYSQHLRKIPYSVDSSGFSGVPSKVLIPNNKLDIQMFISEGSGIVVRGGGSSFSGGSVAVNDSVILDMSRLCNVLEVDPSRKTVTVEAGMILDELNEFLDSYDLEFPVIPMNHSTTTIGSMVATNASGIRSNKYKRVSEWVEELVVVDGNGKSLKVGRLDINNFIGMEGITGVIFSVKLRVIKKVRTRSITVYRSDSITKLTDIIRKFKTDSNVSMIQLIGREVSLSLGLQDNYHLFVEYDNLDGELTGDSYGEKLSLLDSIYSLMASKGFSRVVDPKVFLDKLPNIMEYLEVNRIPHYCEVGNGVVYSFFKRNDDGKAQSFLTNIRRLRGNVTSGLGIGRLSKEFLDDVEKKLVVRIKNRYDPQFRINPGVLIDNHINDSGGIVDE